MLKGIQKRYGDIPVFITENGCALYDEVDENGEIHDDKRIDFMKNVFHWMLKAREEGCNVIGYYAWSNVDVYSWINGYKKRYGLVYVDFDHDLKRDSKEKLVLVPRLYRSQRSGINAAIRGVQRQATGYLQGSACGFRKQWACFAALSKPD